MKEARLQLLLITVSDHDSQLLKQRPQGLLSNEYFIELIMCFGALVVLWLGHRTCD